MVQLYVGDIEASLPRPMRELKAFSRLVLDPGESREIAFELPPRAFAFFDAAGPCWRIEAGSFEVSAGFSAADIRQKALVDLKAADFPI